MVSDISRYAVIAIIELKDPVTLIKRNTFVIQLTKISLKLNWKVLRPSYTMNSDMELLFVPTFMGAIKCSSCPHLSEEYK